MPLKFSKKAALEPFGFLNTENATYALGLVACQRWVLIVTSALTERRKTQPRVFVISEVCGAILQANIRARRRDRCLDICCRTKSDALPKGQKKKNHKLYLLLSDDFRAALRSHNDCQKVKLKIILM